MFTNLKPDIRDRVNCILEITARKTREKRKEKTMRSRKRTTKKKKRTSKRKRKETLENFNDLYKKDNISPFSIRELLFFPYQRC